MIKNKNRKHRNRSIKYIPVVTGAAVGLGSATGVSFVPQVASLSLPLIVLILFGVGVGAFFVARAIAELIARKYDTKRLENGLTAKQMLGERVIDSSIRSKEEAIKKITELKSEQEKLNKKMNAAQATLRYFSTKSKHMNDIEPVIITKKIENTD